MCKVSCIFIYVMLDTGKQKDNIAGCGPKMKRDVTQENHLRANVQSRDRNHPTVYSISYASCLRGKSIGYEI